MCYILIQPLHRCARVSAPGSHPEHARLLPCAKVLALRTSHYPYTVDPCSPLSAAVRLGPKLCKACLHERAGKVLDPLGQVDCNWDELVRKLLVVESERVREAVIEGVRREMGLLEL